LKAHILVLLLILVADIGSAIGVVYTRHQSRHLAVQLGMLEKARDDAVAEWSRLQLEQAWLADAGQIETKARGQLRMTEPEQSKILVIRE
jgi:cell division protein FtsL